MRLKILFEAVTDGDTITVAALPGCISGRDTLEQARRHIREAIEVYLDADDTADVATGGHIEEIMVSPRLGRVAMGPSLEPRLKRAAQALAACAPGSESGKRVAAQGVR